MQDETQAGVCPLCGGGLDGTAPPRAAAAAELKPADPPPSRGAPWQVWGVVLLLIHLPAWACLYWWSENNIPPASATTEATASDPGEAEASERLPTTAPAEAPEQPQEPLQP
jgi:hypothetical protein